MKNYIMTESLFNQLCQISAFNNVNGSTYQEHILIIAGERIPTKLHEAVRKAVSGEAALKILEANNIPYTHSHRHQEPKPSEQH